MRSKAPHSHDCPEPDATAVAASRRGRNRRPPRPHRPSPAAAAGAPAADSAVITAITAHCAAIIAAAADSAATTAAAAASQALLETKRYSGGGFTEAAMAQLMALRGLPRTAEGSHQAKAIFEARCHLEGLKGCWLVAVGLFGSGL